MLMLNLLNPSLLLIANYLTQFFNWLKIDYSNSLMHGKNEAVCIGES